LENSRLSEKEEFESQLAEKEAAQEELQKQKEEAENEVFPLSIILDYSLYSYIRFTVYLKRYQTL